MTCSPSIWKEGQEFRVRQPEDSLGGMRFYLKVRVSLRRGQKGRIMVAGVGCQRGVVNIKLEFCNLQRF